MNRPDSPDEDSPDEDSPDEDSPDENVQQPLSAAAMNPQRQGLPEQADSDAKDQPGDGKDKHGAGDDPARQEVVPQQQYSQQQYSQQQYSQQQYSQQQYSQQQELPLAMVEGSPVTELPADLYIPPDALEIFLETFEGPLDLLLYLIRRQNMDILNINVSSITKQYIEYIRIMENMRFELAAEYLVMAAMLAEIKSRYLLPRREHDETDEADPRAELIRRLQEYERFKLAAENFDDMPRLDRDIAEPQPDIPKTVPVKKHPEVSLQDMLLALREVLRRSELFERHHVEREKLSTRERMSQILERLSAEEFTEFTRLFRPEEGRLGLVVTFLAVLELVKESLIELVQADIFGEIHLRARGSAE